jgi:hypothetical protein
MGKERYTAALGSQQVAAAREERTGMRNATSLQPISLRRI